MEIINKLNELFLFVKEALSFKISRTFEDFLLLPNLTKKEHIPENVVLKTPLVKFSKGEIPSLSLNIPMTSAAMQSVSGPKLAIELAKYGGLSFIFCSQSIEEQVEMIRKVKKYKAGFVVSDSNVTPDQTMEDVLKVLEATGHSTMGVTEDGTPNGKLLGIITRRDYREGKTPLTEKVSNFMKPFPQLVVGKKGITLTEANDLIWKERLSTLPIIDEHQKLCYFVFSKDHENHQENPNELSDASKRLLVGAAINTHDYKDRVPALIDAGVDILCIDSSDGHSEWQKECLIWVKSHYDIPIGAGNVVTSDGFQYLVNHGADFVKIGIGGGSICTTREQKRIGRGQASAVIAIAKTRKKYFQETGVYVPICSDGGIKYDSDITVSLSLGADFIMAGKYFAKFEESEGETKEDGGKTYKRYWGEGSFKAKNYQRYNEGGSKSSKFDEGIEGFVEYVGRMGEKQNLPLTLEKIKATMCSCGSITLEEFRNNARYEIVSPSTLKESGTSSIIKN